MGTYGELLSMYYAQITSGVVTAETETHGAINSPDMIQRESLYPSVLGHSYANGVFTPPPPPSLVPTKITMRQARLVLFDAGLLNAVPTAINALPSPAKDKAMIEWEYSNDVVRHNGFVSALGPALGLTEEQIDALFIAGAAL